MAGGRWKVEGGRHICLACSGVGIGTGIEKQLSRQLGRLRPNSWPAIDSDSDSDPDADNRAMGGVRGEHAAYSMAAISAMWSLVAQIALKPEESPA